MQTSFQKLKSEQTEKLIDEIGLPAMLELMAEICYEKGQHLRENWQDENAAKKWDQNGKRLAAIAPRIYG